MSSLFNLAKGNSMANPIEIFTSYKKNNDSDFTEVMFGDNKANYSLLFDGSKLSLMRDDKELKSWKGTAGNKEYNYPEYQNIKDKGPLPEGYYNVSQDKYYEMYGRGGFTIHGGVVPGSRGCIDLTNQNEDFMKTFRALGRNLRLKVKYPQRNLEENI